MASPVLPFWEALVQKISSIGGAYDGQARTETGGWGRETEQDPGNVIAIRDGLCRGRCQGAGAFKSQGAGGSRQVSIGGRRVRAIKKIYGDRLAELRRSLEEAEQDRLRSERKVKEIKAKIAEVQKEVGSLLEIDTQIDHN